MSRNSKKTLRNVGFDYNSQPKERLWSCNICGSSHSIVISKKDRYGFDVSANLCLECGLVYISPRMEQRGYEIFYQKFYRPLVSHYLQREINATTIKKEQKEYAQEVFEWIDIFLTKMGSTLKILDVGGSTGIVANVFKENLTARELNIEATVIDPSPDELAVAKKLGLETVEGLVESVDIGKKCWDFILLCQTIDHLMDVKKTISIIRDALTENGLFFVDIVEWEYNVRQKGVKDSIKIDHPFNFTRQTTIPFLGRMGFQIVSESILVDGHLIGFLCKKAAPTKCSFSKVHADSLLSLIREKQALLK